jgi:hypothetical protein
MTVKRSRSKPKKYPNIGTGKSKNSRMICPTYDKNGTKRYMSKASKQFRSEEDTTKIERVSPLWFCEVCKTVIWNEDELKKIPK